MIAVILDFQLKSLKFISNDVIKSQTIKKLRDLYSDEQLANELNPLDLTGNHSIWQNTTISSSSNSIITVLFDDDSNDNNNVDNVNEVNAYLNLQILKQKFNSLDWWKNNSKRFSLLN